MKTIVKRALIVGGITAVAVGAAYFIFKGKKGNPNTLETPPDLTDPVVNECLTFPIGRGAGYTKVCERPGVKVIQAWLNEQDWLYQIYYDGMFGPQTEELLEYWTKQKTVDRALYDQMVTEIDPNFVHTIITIP
jgi:hypothetical protein